MPYIPVGAIVGAIHMQNTISRHRREEEEEAKKKEEEPKSPIDKALANRAKTYSGIYSDVGTALDTFSTSELAEYYIQRFGDSALRYFLEQEIIVAEISKEKEAI